MRFGIAPLFDCIATLKKIAQEEGYLDFTEFDFTEYARNVIHSGFDHIEISSDISYIIPESLTEKTVEELIEIRDEEKISYSVHLPVFSIELASPNERVRRASVKCVVESIKSTEPIQPECYVIHLTGVTAAEFSKLNISKKSKELINRGMLGFSAKSLQEILSMTDLSPRKLAVENVEFSFDLTQEVVEELDLSICLDMGHALAGYSGALSILEFLNEELKRIVEIHLHDGYHREEGELKVQKDHLPLGAGSLPVAGLMNFLDREKFSGPIVFELLFEEAKASLETIKRLYPGIRIKRNT